MDYEGQICKPPMEIGRFMLPVAVGCSYNACRFCTLFKHLKFRELPLDKVEAELLRVKNLGGSPKKIFLGDGNPFGLSAERLLEVLALIHKYFPDCYDVSMDATVTNVSEKSGEELRALRDNGVSELYVGIECGLEDVLAFMRKDHDSEEARRQIARLREAGIMYSAHIMCGTAGAGRGIENAEATARFLNETGPHRIVNTSLFIHRSAPLFSDIESGRFTPPTELENMLEERRLLELLTVPVDFYDGLHDYMEVRTKGRLPQDRERMLARLDMEIERKRERAEMYVVYAS